MHIIRAVVVDPSPLKNLLRLKKNRRQQVGQYVVHCRSLAVCIARANNSRQIKRLLPVASIASRAGAGACRSSRGCSPAFHEDRMGVSLTGRQ